MEMEKNRRIAMLRQEIGDACWGLGTEMCRGRGGAPEGVEGEPLAGVGEDGLFHEGNPAVLDGRPILLLIGRDEKEQDNE